MHQMDNVSAHNLFRENPLIVTNGLNRNTLNGLKFFTAKATLLPHSSLAESLRDMTRLAASSERTAMRIITAMAPEACGGGCDFRYIFAGMTRVTLQTLVRTGKRKLRFLAVIETPKFKSIGVMAARTGRANPALVIFVFVAALAGPRSILVGCGPVTLLARYRCVKSDKWKPGQIMIEGDLLAPARFGVTRLAFFPELTLMRIVVLVAGDAGRTELVLIEIAFVAGVAFDLLVLSFEGKFGLRMIKANRCPLFRRVAGLTFAAVAAAMRILRLVAVDARAG